MSWNSPEKSIKTVILIVQKLRAITIRITLIRNLLLLYKRSNNPTISTRSTHKPSNNTNRTYLMVSNKSALPKHNSPNNNPVIQKSVANYSPNNNPLTNQLTPYPQSTISTQPPQSSLTTTKIHNPLYYPTTTTKSFLHPPILSTRIQTTTSN